MTELSMLSLVPKPADIVDAQLHIEPGAIATTLAAMDALGITAALIDEYWVSRGLANEPHHLLAGSGVRPINPTAELATLLHPDRFAWLLRISRLDPEYGSIIRMVRDAPGGRALRIDPGMSLEDMRLWAEGGYDHVLGAAADWDLPIFVFAPDMPAGLARAARAFPTLRLCIDHCGLMGNSTRSALDRPLLTTTQQMALFDRVCALADHPNVTLKWGHMSNAFDQPSWPGEALAPLLRRAVDAYGADRVFWASDYSANQRDESWAELLYGVRDCGVLSEAERTAVLGGALRGWLGWERPE
jgi:predicted TIM-barrel fold metal-dependent hydrolase